MAGKRRVDFTEETEFGGGPGLIDATRRAERVIGQATGGPGGVGEELMEIYATNPADPNSDPETAQIERP